MKHTFLMFDHFGEFCADGEIAKQFLKDNVLPLIDDNDLIFDFSKVRNMNSSFVNALFANLVRSQGPGILEKICFSNYNELIKLLIVSALERGLKEAPAATDVGSARDL